MMFDVKQFGKDKVHTVGMLLTKSSFLGRKFERKSFCKDGTFWNVATCLETRSDAYRLNNS